MMPVPSDKISACEGDAPPAGWREALDERL
jgi:hypothetical protein